MSDKEDETITVEIREDDHIVSHKQFLWNVGIQIISIIADVLIIAMLIFDRF